MQQSHIWVRPEALPSRGGVVLLTGCPPNMKLDGQVLALVDLGYDVYQRVPAEGGDFGNSRCAVNIDAVGRELKELISAQRPVGGGMHVVGASAGGMAATLLARLHPEGVLSVVIQSSPMVDIDTLINRQAKLYSDSGPISSYQAGWWDRVQWGKVTQREALSRAYTKLGLSNVNSLRFLPNCQAIPHLAFYGDQDEWFDSHPEVEYLREQCPGTNVRVFMGLGHVSFGPLKIASGCSYGNRTTPLGSCERLSEALSEMARSIGAFWRRVEGHQ